MRMFARIGGGVWVGLLAWHTAGCGGDQLAGQGSTPTWHQDVAPLVMQHCTGCHKAGGIAPFALTSYDSAKPFAKAMNEALASGEMPPWSARDTDACKPRFGWKDDLRLSAAEKDRVRLWAAGGAPEGDPARAAALPEPPALDLASPSVHTTMPKPYPVAGTRDLFRCAPLPYVFDSDVWLNGVQVTPGNSKVVHHVLVWLDETGQGDTMVGPDGTYPCSATPGFTANLISAWAPGAVPVETPGNVGIKVKKGSHIVINIHYHPTSDTEMDATSVDLRWTTQKPSYETVISLVGNFTTPGSVNGLLPGPHDPASGPVFLIPAGSRDHTEAMHFTIPAILTGGAKLWAIGTHMHYVGTDMKIDMDRSHRAAGVPANEPVSECLLETPNWNFHWQRAYLYDTDFDNLPTMRTGDAVNLRCLYDNSLQNPHVREALQQQGQAAPMDVRLGEMTLDEMCLGVFGLAYKVN